MHIPSKRAWLPPKLYRAVHSGYTGNGLHARGYRPEDGYKLVVDDYNFQLHAENHFCWRYPIQSPFLSLTANLDRALNIFKMFQNQGKSDVLLLEMDTASWKRATNEDIWDCTGFEYSMGRPLRQRVSCAVSDTSAECSVYRNNVTYLQHRERRLRLVFYVSKKEMRASITNFIKAIFSAMSFI